MLKPEFSIIIPIKNRTNIQVNFEPPGLSIFRDHKIELSGLPKHDCSRRGTDLNLKLLLNNLQSLQNFIEKYNFEVIIIDFNSEDLSPKNLKLKYPNLNFIFYSENSFFSRGKGLNIGLQFATKKNIMFCDADMYFSTDTLFQNASQELKNGKVFFPICFDLIEPTHQIGYWRESGYGIMFATRDVITSMNFKWSEYETLGKEDDDAFAFFKGIVSRYKVKGYYHQWHPSSKFFKNQNYKSAQDNSNSPKILINFDENLLEEIHWKSYLIALKEDRRYLCIDKLDYDTKYVLNSNKLKQIFKKQQIEEYEKKYCRKIEIYCMENYSLLPQKFFMFQIKYPQNPKWLNNVLDWMLRIEKNDHSWTLEGTNKFQLSSCSLFAKLIKIYEKYYKFDHISIRNKILKFFDPEDSFFKQDQENDRIISESRQSYSALINLGYGVIDNPKYNINVDKYFPEPLYFMTDKYWENPWKAGAHLSHYVFFCYLTKQQEKIELVFKKISKYAKKDGWYYGNPTSEQIINGIMKIFTAYDVVGKKLEGEMLRGVVDGLLGGRGGEGGCGVYDYVYVLVRCLEWGGYRESEIRERLYGMYDVILGYQVSDGGFKYSKDLKRRDTYAGREIGPEGELGSVHATTVFSMALAMMNKVLDMGLDLGLAFS